MGIGEWIASSLGFIVVMLGAMCAGVGLVVYATLATMRGYVAGEEWETSPAPAPDPQRSAPAAPAPVRPTAAEPAAVRLAD
jgi:hypothetical protein